jgi:hypothetical protein
MIARMLCRLGLHRWYSARRTSGRWSMHTEPGGPVVMIAACAETFHCKRHSCRASVRRCYVEHDLSERVRYSPERRRQRERLP